MFKFLEILTKVIKAYLNIILKKYIIINAYVNVDKQGTLESKNWGDDLNYHLLKEITKKDIKIYFGNFELNYLKKKNYLVIGSTINFLCTKKSIIWGAGLISNYHEIRELPYKVLAVRGPLTRNYLLKRGINCPEVYGDPALLLPYVYKKPKTQELNKIKFGLIPHHSDLNLEIIKHLLTENEETILIDIVNYESWKDIIDKINSCDCVFSSSLHGLVVAEAYGIKNIWVEFSNNLIGGHYKFHDFFLSINRDRKHPYKISSNSKLSEIADSDKWVIGKIDLSALIKSSPFQINLNRNNEHPLNVRKSEEIQ